MEILALIIVMSCVVSILIVSYGKQQEKYRRKQEWINEVKRQEKIK